MRKSCNKMKQKTHKSAGKRFRRTRSGKILMRRETVQHLANRKSSRTKRNAGADVKVSKANKKRISRLI